jgi:hypothetical protein
MAKVFISYRREDSRYQARSIYNAFLKALPPDSVFMDVDSIKPGDDFVEILEARRVGSALWTPAKASPPTANAVREAAAYGGGWPSDLN